MFCSMPNTAPNVLRWAWKVLPSMEFTVHLSFYTQLLDELREHKKLEIISECAMNTK